MSSLKDLQDLIQEKYGIEPSSLDPSASIRGAGLDSLALVEFLFAVEDRFGISLPEQQTEIDTLAELATLVDGLRATQKA
jgi:acyl carrier protein